MSVARKLKYSVDLQAHQQVRSIGTLLNQGDSKAHEIVLYLYNGTEAAALDGYTVSGDFDRADGHVVPLTGSIQGNAVTVSLSGACYAVQGYSVLTVKLEGMQESRTVFKATANIDPESNGELVKDEAYITFGEMVGEVVENYLKENPVTVEESDPTVPEWAKQENPPKYTKADVGLSNVANVRQYSASNPPPYPVTSVNGQTGDVIIEIKGGDGGVAVEVDPTVPAWAKTPNKPTYTAEEVGALTLGTLYRVGDIYITTNSTSPAEIFGGTWERIEDRFLLAAGSTYAAGSTGGESTHTLTVDEMPTHYHLAGVVKSGKAGTDYVHPVTAGIGADSTIQREFLSRTSDTGGGQAHNNMPPYLAVYVWRRVA